MFRFLIFMVVALQLQGYYLLAQNDTHEVIGKSFSNVSDAVANKDAAKVLNLRLQKRDYFNPQIFELSNLEVLDLKSNNFTFIPNNFYQLPKVAHITLSENKLLKLPDFSTCKQLYFLAIDRNRIGEIPATIFKNINLKYLDVSWNIIGYLDDGFTKLNKLEVLQLHHNMLFSLPERWSSLKSLKYLDLSYNKLSILPSDFWETPRIEQIDLSNNQLIKLPIVKENNNYLKTLSISNNNIKSLPQNIHKLKNLETILVSNNQLENLPETLKRLKKLKYIVIIGNPIETSTVEWWRKQLPNVNIIY